MSKTWIASEMELPWEEPLVSEGPEYLGGTLHRHLHARMYTCTQTYTHRHKKKLPRPNFVSPLPAPIM